jgi:hypothetical protein
MGLTFLVVHSDMDLVKIDLAPSGDQLEFPQLHPPYASKDSHFSHPTKDNHHPPRKELKVVSE